MIDEKVFYSVKEFSELISISKHSVRQLIIQGKIKSIKIGDGIKAKIRIPSSELIRLLSIAHGNKENESE